MTADELASFRALLRAQAEAPRRRPRLLAPRERRPVVAAAAPVAPSPPCAPWPVSRAEILVLAASAAAPPPLFGRRAVDAVAATPDATAAPRLSPEPLTLRTVVSPSAPHLWEVPPTAPEPEPPPSPPAVAPGGWTRARPPSAQRRLLGRLESVFLAERLGLDARREAQRG